MNAIPPVKFYALRTVKEGNIWMIKSFRPCVIIRSRI